MSLPPEENRLACYRGLMHVHSIFSYDGSVEIPTLAETLRAENLDFAVMVEHVESFDGEEFANYLAECSKHSTDDLLFIPGMEYTFHEGDARIEVILIGEQAYVEATSLAVVLEHKKRHEPILLLPHPLKFKVIPNEVLAAVELIEVWNRRYDGGAFVPAPNISLYQKQVRSSGSRGVFAIGGVDFHNYGDPLDVVVAVKCQTLGAAEVLAALRGGQFHTEYGDLLIPSHLGLGAGLLIMGKLKRGIRKFLYQILRRIASLPIFKMELFRSSKKKIKAWVH